MIGVVIGLLYANASEWLVHRYLLHGRGRKRSSFWSFHFHEHHRNARLNGHIDTDYAQTIFRWNGQGKEALTLSLSALIHLLVFFPLAPYFAVTVALSAVWYYRVHRKSHLDPDWARRRLPWHYDHHMGPDQHTNWCVSWPWFDHILGTRQPYVGTEREARDTARRAARRAALTSPRSSQPPPAQAPPPAPAAGTETPPGRSTPAGS